MLQGFLKISDIPAMTFWLLRSRDMQILVHDDDLTFGMNEFRRYVGKGFFSTYERTYLGAGFGSLFLSLARD